MRTRPTPRALPIVASLTLLVALLLPRSGFSSSLAAGGATGPLGTHPASQGTGHLPLSFEPNRGQFDRRVRFVARSGSSTLFLTARDAVFSLPAGQNRRSAVRLHVAGASHVQPRGTAELPGKVNYFIGRHRWTNIPTYSRVVYPNIYPHTDLVYFGSQGHLEYDWVLKPGASASVIHLQISGASRAHFDARGDLVLQSHGAVLRQGPVVAYQQDATGRRMVAARYVLAGPHDIRLTVGAYDPSKPLIVDPPVLSFSTYIGEGDLDNTYLTYFSIAVDGAGNAYVTGTTSSASFPVVGSIRTYQGQQDMFITKLNSTGTQILYSTYLGGSAKDGGLGIAVDPSGDAYVSGATSSTDFPNAAGGTLPHYGGFDAVVVKLDPTGAHLLYTALYGTSQDDYGWGIALGSAGNAYITGLSAGHAFVASFASNGTFLGDTVLASNGFDAGVGIALDSNNNVWVAGTTSATHVTGSGGFQAGYGGGANDGFVAEFAAHTLTQQYFTYLGGSGDDEAQGIAIDASNSIYVTGSTHSSGFPTKDAFQACSGSSYDAFVVKLNPSATAMTYGTCLGGNKDDVGADIAVDAAGEAVVVGTTESPDFPVAKAIQSSYGGSGSVYGDGFVIKINAAGSGLVYSTYLGGSGDDVAVGVALDSAGDACAVGWTTSTDFPTAPGGGALESTDPAPSGAVFVTKISDMAAGPPPGTPTSTPTAPYTATATATYTSTPTFTATPTGTATATSTSTVVAAGTATSTLTSTATATSTAVPTATMTATAAPTATRTPRPTATPTEVPPPGSPTVTLNPSGKVTAGSKLKIVVVTEPHASLQITLRVKKKKTTLYKVTLTGKAKKSGKYSHTVTITYFPSSKIKATITVTVTTPGGDAVSSASITIVPRK